jgi:hypothetical protein
MHIAPAKKEVERNHAFEGGHADSHELSLQVKINKGVVWHAWQVIRDTVLEGNQCQQATTVHCQTITHVILTRRHG